MRYPVHTAGRTFVVGDIHGCWFQLMTLLKAIGFDFLKDILYSTGDLGDRGPDSLRCLLLIYERWFRPVRGNHEELLIDAMHSPRFSWEHWELHGGLWSRKVPNKVLAELAKDVAALPVVIVVGEGKERFNIFHAEFFGDDAALDEIEHKDKAPLVLQHGEEMISGRVSPDKQKGLSRSFVGHRISSNAHVIGSQVYLDTGAFIEEQKRNGRNGLTIVEPSTDTVYRYNY